VIKPRLLLAKLCRDRVQVPEEEVRKEFERRYGEKVDVQIILYPKEQLRVLQKIWAQVRQSDKEWDHAARSQPEEHLAMTCGQIQPISRHSGVDIIEKVAFGLRPGEVSQVIETPPQGVLIMKCIKVMPPDRTKIFENERDALQREVFEKKIVEEAPKVFKELLDEAKPVRYLEPEKAPQKVADLKRTSEEMLRTGPLPPRKLATSPE
jgi:hypothetical protein